MQNKRKTKRQKDKEEYEKPRDLSPQALFLNFGMSASSQYRIKVPGHFAAQLKLSTTQ
jgi:hypothetical protein